MLISLDNKTEKDNNNNAWPLRAFVCTLNPVYTHNAVHLERIPWYGC